MTRNETIRRSSAGMQGRGKREYPEKTRWQAAPCSTIPTCEDPGVNPPGIEPRSQWWEASALATAPPLPLLRACCTNEPVYSEHVDELHPKQKIPVDTRETRAERIKPESQELGTVADMPTESQHAIVFDTRKRFPAALIITTRSDCIGRSSCLGVHICGRAVKAQGRRVWRPQGSGNSPPVGGFAPLRQKFPFAVGEVNSSRVCGIKTSAALNRSITRGEATRCESDPTTGHRERMHTEPTTHREKIRWFIRFFQDHLLSPTTVFLNEGTDRGGAVATHCTRIREDPGSIPGPAMVLRNHFGQMLGWVRNKPHGRFLPIPSPMPLPCATCTVSNDLAVDETPAGGGNTAIPRALQVAEKTGEDVIGTCLEVSLAVGVSVCTCSWLWKHVTIFAGGASRNAPRLTEQPTRMQGKASSEAVSATLSGTSPAITCLTLARRFLPPSGGWATERASPCDVSTALELDWTKICFRFEDVLHTFGVDNRLERLMRVIDVSMEKPRNERAGETGDPRENPPTNAIIRHDSHVRKSGVIRPGIGPGSPWWEVVWDGFYSCDRVRIEGSTIVACPNVGALRTRRTATFDEDIIRRTTLYLHMCHRDSKCGRSGSVGRAIPSGALVAQWIERLQVGPQLLSG
ncbi:hypothetical protein PR048_023297 [Dryococelus australis]|uniref:Uncharacterized protein n=1 Tax=Dryococelus australis TaxID=614101 RepID=A0ABQ9GTP3_9NEOP|nr:hypothetical protein PR048_023297 [Dryococelus australis]